jgi:predicted ferric reductase
MRAQLRQVAQAKRVVEGAQVLHNSRHAIPAWAREVRTPASILLLALALLLGAAAAALALPSLLPELGGSVLGSEPKGYWYLSRASGVAAYLLLWLSMAVGLGLTNRLARVWPGLLSAYDLHKHLSLLGLAFALFHAVVLLGDRYMSYNLVQLLLPFGSTSHRQEWVGLGQLAFYLLAVVGLSFYFRLRIGGRWWRVIHFASFAVFALALAHGLMSGTDSGSVWAGAMYWLSAASLLFLTVYRILNRYADTVTNAEKSVRG